MALSEVSPLAETVHPALAPAAAAAQWLADFEAALTAGDADALAGLFQDDGIWRDLVALTWHLGTVVGASHLAERLVAAARTTRPSGFAVAADRTAPRQVTRAGTGTLEALFDFETAAGRGSGVLRLAADPGRPGRHRAWTLVNDVRDGDRDGVLRAASAGGGCHSCHVHGSCVEHCPVGINPTAGIAGLKRWSLVDLLGGRLP